MVVVVDRGRAWVRRGGCSEVWVDGQAIHLASSDANPLSAIVVVRPALHTGWLVVPCDEQYNKLFNTSPVSQGEAGRTSQ
jgi:hypothetical protein